MAEPPTYEWIDGAERLECYEKGGYHPVQIDDIFHDRYRIIDKLGYGGWSTVWLAHDDRCKHLVALKIGTASSLPHEVKTLRALSNPSSSPLGEGVDSVPTVLDEFCIDGPNGTHRCYTTPLAIGSLRECSLNRLFSLQVARALSYQLVLAVAYVHSLGHAHGDIHLRNVLVKAPSKMKTLSIAQFREEYGHPLTYPIERTDGIAALPDGVPANAVVSLEMGKRANEFTLADANIILSDFGESFEPGSVERLGQDCHTPVDFRPPEATLDPASPLSFSADIWSLALAIWDIIGMQPLFQSAFYGEDRVMCQIIDTFGPPPAKWEDKWEYRDEYFDDSWKPNADRSVWPDIDTAFDARIQKYRLEDKMGVFDEEEKPQILDMVRRMLQYEPTSRPTASAIMECDWMKNYGKPAYLQAKQVSGNALDESI